MLIRFEPNIVGAVISNHATVLIYPKKVVKIVSNRRKAEINDDLGYKGEVYFLKKYQSEYFVRLLDAPRRQLPTVVMENVGVMIGSPRLMYSRHRTKKLRNWLEGLDKELQRLNIAHGDISPCNILFNGERYTLIDFEVATEPGDLEHDKRFAKDRKNIALLIAQTKGDTRATTNT